MGCVPAILGYISSGIVSLNAFHQTWMKIGVAEDSDATVGCYFLVICF